MPLGWSVIVVILRLFLWANELGSVCKTAHKGSGVSARWWQGEEFRLEYAAAYKACETKAGAFGIKELEGSPRPRCAKAGRHLGPYSGKRNRASYGWLAARLNCPSAADRAGL